MLKCQIWLLERITLLSIRHTEEEGIREALNEVSDGLSLPRDFGQLSRFLAVSKFSNARFFEGFRVKHFGYSNG